MKLNLSLALLASAVIAHGTTEEKNGATCTNAIQCFIQNLASNEEFIKKATECAKEQDEAKQQHCISIAVGMKPEQMEVINKVKPANEECSKAPVEKAGKCITECKGDDTKKCIESCTQTAQLESLDCLAKKASLSNFDSKTALECSNNCHQKEFAEFFNCNYKCSEEIYKGLGAEMKASNSKDEKEGGDKKTDGKKTDDKKPSSNANSVQFGSLNLVAFALPLAYLFVN